ncbi:TPA: hypothetical protein ACXE5S_004546 [Escherichia coli]|uniref:MrpH family fimbial adhesin n=1 Tax=Escherichia coli TaxID=562 RepID=UPI001BD9B1EE|nr:hypothetical protein [Salmonella enterica subsp. enterica serovar Enteritidis]EHD1465104.1 hypothetical protein [Escherichia coli]EHO0045192.1 hypothetical protein [Escherichia coli]EHT7346889.1 hypothetical protein [Escherichia coli]HAV9747683.1 hypothetical protein [Escherichia coli]
MMQIYFKIIRRFFISLILLVPFSSFAVTCSGGALYGGGYWWKGTSKVNISISNKNIQYINTAADGTGIYRLTATLTFPQGVQNYYRSTGIGGPWSRANLPSGILPGDIQGCVWGYAAYSKSITFPVGGGTLEASVSLANALPWPADAGQIAGEGAPSARINIATYPGEYMVGTSGPSVLTDNVDLRVNVRVINKITPGVYNVNLAIPIAAMSAWFEYGTNYWWHTNPAGTLDFNHVIDLPVTIRINDDGKPTNPTISCSVSSTSKVISHGTLIMSDADGDEKQDAIYITCNGASSASISLIGNSDTSNGVIVNMGGGVSSILSASSDRTVWQKKLPNVLLKNGNNPVYIRSVLSLAEQIQPGVYSGNAVAVINIK